MGALAGWAPPQTVQVTLLYADGTPQKLWTVEAVFPPPGRPQDGTRWFMACGPAGQRVPPVSRSFVSGLPDNAYVVLWTERNQFGTLVFARAPQRLLN